MDDSQLLKGVLDLAVLSALHPSESYGYQIVTELREAGHESVGEASVYGTLRRLHNDELVTSRMVPSESGPARKYYTLTESGRQRFRDDTKTWRRFVETMKFLLNEE
jgi:PadR family transcriptional regulator PadR